MSGHSTFKSAQVFGELFYDPSEMKIKRFERACNKNKRIATQITPSAEDFYWYL